jgi:hypothetical protein
MAINLKPFDWTRQVIDASGEIPIIKGCFSILVTNIGGVGASAASIDGFPINPALVAGQNGESWSVGGPENTVIGKTTLEILFAAGVGRVFVQQLYYISTDK